MIAYFLLFTVEPYQNGGKYLSFPVDIPLFLFNYFNLYRFLFWKRPSSPCMVLQFRPREF